MGILVPISFAFQSWPPCKIWDFGVGYTHDLRKPRKIEPGRSQTPPWLFVFCTTLMAHWSCINILLNYRAWSMIWIANGYAVSSIARKPPHLENKQILHHYIPPTLPSKTRWSADNVKFIFVTTAGFSSPEKKVNPNHTTN